MKKRYLVLSSIAIFALLSLSGCNSVARDSADNSSGIKDGAKSRDANQPIISDDPKPFEPVEPNLGSITAPSNGGASENNSSDSTTIKTINGTYSINIKPELDSMTAGQTQNIHYEIINFFTKKPADKSVIKNLKFKIDQKYAEFFDPKGRHGDTIEFVNGADSTGDIAIKSTSLSGQVRMNFNAVIDNTDINLTKSFPITIEKNKSSSIAIVPYATVYDKGLFIQKYVIHVVDSYGNKAKDGTAIQTGVINNPKLYTGAFNPKVYGALDMKKRVFNFEDNTTTLPNSVTSQDTLIILANEKEHRPINLGGWDVQNISNGKLYLYDLETSAKNLSFAIGDEYRYDACSETIMNAAASSFEVTQVKDGLAYAELRYTPAMVGKDIFIYANSKLDDKRIGISRRVNLSGTGLNEYTFTCKGPEKKSDDTNSSIPPATSSCTMNYRMIENDSLKPAQFVQLKDPVLAGDPIPGVWATIDSLTNCDGWVTVTIHNVPEGKSASWKIGGVDTIAPEKIKNQR